MRLWAGGFLLFSVQSWAISQNCVALIEAYQNLSRFGYRTESELLDSFHNLDEIIQVIPLSAGSYKIVSGNLNDGLNTFVARIERKGNKSSNEFDAIAANILEDMTGAQVVQARVLSPSFGIQLLHKLKEEVEFSSGKLDAVDLNTTIEKVPNSQVAIQMYLKGDTLESVNKSRVKLNSEQRRDLADLVIGRLILGIPDNHEANFMLSGGKVVSIDHALQARKKKGSLSPFDFHAQFYMPQLPYAFFGLENVDGVHVEAIPTILSYASEKFKNRIRSMKLEDFSQMPEKYRSELSERIEHMQRYLYSLENQKRK